MTVVEAQSAEAAFRAVAAERILIFDGAYGTAIQKHKLSEADYRGDLDLPMDQKGNNDLLCLTRPDIIEGIHTAYFDAGADMVETNTFSSTRIAMADYGCEHLVREINIAAGGARGGGGRGARRAAALRRGIDRTDQQDAVDLARRQRRGVPRDRL